MNTWYKKGTKSQFPETLKIQHPNIAEIRFLEEPRIVKVKDEDRWCAEVEYLGGDAKTPNGIAQVGTKYTLWLSTTMAVALSRIFGNPNKPDDVPVLKNKTARVFRSDRFIRNQRIYDVVEIKAPLMKAAEPKVIGFEKTAKEYADAFKDSFLILKEVTVEEMTRWFKNKFGTEIKVDVVITELVKSGIAEYDKATEKVRALV